MTRRSGGIPPVPSRNPQERQFMEAMKEAVEVGKGHRGHPLDRYLSLRDLLDAGLAKLVSKIGSGYVPGSALEPASEPNQQDLSTPPAPTGLAVTKGLGLIFLTWDEAPYRNHAHTNIYRSTEDNFSNATVITNGLGRIYADPVPYEVIDQESGDIRGYFYWITFVSDTGVEGPPNAIEGTYQEPAAEPQYMLDLLTARITASQLHAELTGRIDLIDGSDELAGSVAARIKQESTERLAADNSFTQQLNQMSSAIEGNAAAITQESTARSDGDGATASQINQLSTTVNGHTSSIQQHTQSINGINASWSVRMDVNGRVAGVGLMNDGNVSSFQILTSNFAVLDENDPSKVILGTYNGAAIIDGAYIKTASIQSAAIGSLSVDKLVGDTASFVIANIGTATIGSAQLANSIQSTNYSSGAGWKIYKSGAAYFNQVTVRGTVEASVIESSVFKTDSMRFDTGGGRTAPNSFSLEAGYDGGGSNSLTLYYGYIYHPNYGGGHSSTRLSAWNTPIRISAVLHGDLGSVTAKLQIQYDNTGAWTDVKTITGYLNYNGGMCLAYSSSAGRTSYNYFSLRWVITGSTTRFFSSQLLVVNGA